MPKAHSDAQIVGSAVTREYCNADWKIKSVQGRRDKLRVKIREHSKYINHGHRRVKTLSEQIASLERAKARTLSAMDRHDKARSKMKDDMNHLGVILKGRRKLLYRKHKWEAECLVYKSMGLPIPAKPRSIVELDAIAGNEDGGE